MRIRARWTAAALATTAGLAVAACSGSAGSGGPSASFAPATTPPTLQVPSRLGGGTFSQKRTLTLPKGWTAQVWARVDGARMEAWTPQGDLLVSQPGHGTVVEL